MVDALSTRLEGEEPPILFPWLPDVCVGAFASGDRYPASIGEARLAVGGCRELTGTKLVGCRVKIFSTKINDQARRNRGLRQIMDELKCVTDWMKP